MFATLYWLWYTLTCSKASIDCIQQNRRQQFTKEHLDWIVGDYKCVTWSDKSRFQWHPYRWQAANWEKTARNMKPYQHCHNASTWWGQIYGLGDVFLALYGFLLLLFFGIVLFFIWFRITSEYPRVFKCYCR